MQFLHARIRNTMSDKTLTGTWELNDREDRQRKKSLPLTVDENTVCYVCESRAQVRHHVVPVSHGGRNKLNNLVPLCHSCHQELHAPFRTKPAVEPIRKSARDEVRDWFSRNLVT